MMEQSVSLLLDSFFDNAGDVSSLDRVHSSLQSECRDLESRLQGARTQAREAAGDGFSQMQSLAGSLESLSSRIERLRAPERSSVAMVHELSELATEVGRVGELRAYVEVVLQLERLIGDLEDDVFAAASKTPIVSLGRKANPGRSSNRLSAAVNNLRSIETTMAEVAKRRPQWIRLMSAVDVRVDRATAALRPVAVADYRAVLMSIGWPPTLTTSAEGKRHPLAEIQGDRKQRFRESFVALSTLQAVQTQRKERSGENKDAMPETLQAIEELTMPISTKCEVHFRKWLDKPGFVFALAYRTALEHVAFVDSVFQPMLDETSLSYSAREEWVSALVNMVAEHLQKWALPRMLRDLEGDQLSRLWLHTVDQTLDFDRKMQSLALTGIAISNAVAEEGLAGLKTQIFGVHRPCLSAFADRADRLELWARFEREDAQRKLKAVFDSEAAWSVNASNFEGQTLPLSSTSSGDFKPPVVAQRAMSTMWSMIERCKTLPEAVQRLKFVKATACPIFEELSEELLQRCHEVEALKAISDDESMSKVGVCINAARYCESILRGWCEDTFFLELKLAEQHRKIDTRVLTERDALEVEGSIFDYELSRVAHFRSIWLGKLSAAMVRGFEALARDYLRNKSKWLEDGFSYATDTGDIKPSRSLVDALGVLQRQLGKLKDTLDQANFVELWQKLIPALDQLLFQGVVTSGAKFSEQGGQQFANDVKSLFLVFRPYCFRPASFFLGLSDAMKLLSMPREEAQVLFDRLGYEEGEEEEEAELNKILKRCEIRKMTSGIAHRILSSRIL